MKYKCLGVIAFVLILSQFVYFYASILLIPIILLILFIRNRPSLRGYIRFLIPSGLFILLFYTLLGHWVMGLKTVALLSGTSLSLQLYLAFFPDTSLYVLLRETGCPEKPAFIIYGAVNYTMLIKPLIREIQDAQRLRGLEIPKGIKGIVYLPMLFTPLMVRLMKGADHLAESLFFRADLPE